MLFNCKFCGTELKEGETHCSFCGTAIKKVPAPVENENKWICTGCKKEYPAGTKFCSECGGKVEEVKPAAPVVFACTGCGKEYPAGTKFCSECGGKIEEVKPAAPEVFACVGCGKEYPAGTKFCSECGGKIELKNALRERSHQSEEYCKIGEEKENRSDYRSAVEWYKKADSYHAWCRIGHIYQKGLVGNSANMKEALNAYRKAASMEDDNRKNGFAECYLGFFYQSGNCVPRNTKEAVKWFKISASYGNKFAKRELKRLGY